MMFDSIRSMLSSSLAVPVGLVILFFILNGFAIYCKRSPKTNYIDCFIDVLGYGSTITLALSGFSYLEQIDSGDNKMIFFTGLGVFVISASVGYIKIVKEIFQKQYAGEANATNLPTQSNGSPQKSASVDGKYKDLLG